MTISTVGAGVPARESGVGRVVRAGALGTVGAVLGALAVFFVARELLDVSFRVPIQGGDPEPLSAVMVAIACLVPGIAATALFLLLRRFTRRPEQIFLGVALVALALSFLPPLTLPDVATSTKLALAVMHPVAFLPIAGALLGWGLRRGPRV